MAATPPRRPDTASDPCRWARCPASAELRLDDALAVEQSTQLVDHLIDATGCVDRSAEFAEVLAHRAPTPLDLAAESLAIGPCTFALEDDVKRRPQRHERHRDVHIERRAEALDVARVLEHELEHDQLVAGADVHAGK